MEGIPQEGFAWGIAGYCVFRVTNPPWAHRELLARSSQGSVGNRGAGGITEDKPLKVWFVVFEHRSAPGSPMESLSLQWPLRHNPVLGGRALSEEEGEQLPALLCFAFPALTFNICRSISLCFGHWGVCSDGWFGNWPCRDGLLLQKAFSVLESRKTPTLISSLCFQAARL